MPQPDDDKVLIWSSEGFTGLNEELEEGEYPNLAQQFGDGWHDALDSLKVGKGVIIRLYIHENFQGRHITFLPGEECADLGPLGWHDETDSAKVYKVKAQEDDTPSLEPPY